MKKKEMTQRNISVIEFVNNKVPEMVEVKNREWIAYGVKNDYPDYLISLFDRSAKHNAIITGKVHYIKGNGIEVDTSTMTIEQKAKVIDWYNNINYGDCSTDLLFKVTTDIELFDGCYIEVIPNRAGTGIADLVHIGFEKIRISKNKDGYWYSNDWTNYRQSAELTGLKFLPFYKPETFSGLFRYKSYRPGPKVYPVPEYIGAIPYIEIDYEIANFHLNNIKNGFVGGTMVNFNNGIPTQEEQRVIEQKVKGKFTGTDKAGQLIITFSEHKDTAPTVLPLLPNGFDKMFDTLNATVMQEIFTGHKITSLGLFGIKEANGLGSKDELRVAFELFQNGYINAKQKIIESIFNDFAEVSGYGRPFKIVPIQPLTDGLAQSDIIKVMTTDEIRVKAGLPSLAEPVVKMSGHNCSEHFATIENFKKFGVEKSNYRIIKSTEVENKNDVYIREIAFYKEKFIDSEVIQSKILNLLNGNPSATLTDIAKGVGETKTVVTNELNTLIDNEAIKVDVGVYEILPEGQKILEQNLPENVATTILYSYEERKNLPPLLSESRAFCIELLGLNRLYTREEIDKISAIEGRDVWETRGGFFHNTKYDQTTPYCRHIWSQNIVSVK